MLQKASKLTKDYFSECFLCIILQKQKVLLNQRSIQHYCFDVRPYLSRAIFEMMQNINNLPSKINSINLFALYQLLLITFFFEVLTFDIRVVYYYSNSYMRLALIHICFLACLLSCLVALNMSLCTDIQISDLHYYINSNQNNRDIVIKNANQTSTYNLCSAVEVHCPSTNSVIVASLVIVSTQGTCQSYNQSQVGLINAGNYSSGILVKYSSLAGNGTIQMKYPCQGEGIGCPSVQEGILWNYFTQNLLTYTIIIEVVGIILMTLGISIYRGSIVLIGWGTSILILLVIQSFFVFLKGVPSTLISVVMTITLVASFFVGYILGYFPKAGVVCMGLWIGGLIALTLNNIAFYHIDSNPSNLVLYIVAPVLSVSFGIIIIYIKKAFITFASSLIGSYLCLRALSWYLGAFPNEFQISKKYNRGLSPAVPWQFYLYVIALFILTISSSALQTWLFKKKMKKNHQNTDIEEHLNQMQSSLRKQRGNLIQIKKVFEDKQKEPRVLQKSQPRNKTGTPTSIQEISESEQNRSSQQNNNSDEQSLPNYESDEDQKDNKLEQKLIKGKTKR